MQLWCGKKARSLRSLCSPLFLALSSTTSLTHNIQPPAVRVFRLGIYEQSVGSRSEKVRVSACNGYLTG